MEEVSPDPAELFAHLYATPTPQFEGAGGIPAGRTRAGRGLIMTHQKLSMGQALNRRYGTR